MEMDPALQVRKDILDHVIGIIDVQLQATRPRLITGPDDAGILQTDSARHTAWSLLKDGFHHLKEWGPGQEPGTLAGAVAKASVSHSPLAISLRVAAPAFNTAAAKIPHDPRAEILAECVQMLDAALGDLPRSQLLIQNALRTDSLLSAFGIQGFSTQELRKVMSFAEKEKGAPLPALVSQEKISLLRRQMFMYTDALAGSYRDACADMTGTLRTLKTAPPSLFIPKG